MEVDRDGSMECTEHLELFLSLQMLLSMMMLSLFATWHPGKLGLRLPQRLGDGPLSFLIITFQREGLRSLRKTFFGS